MPSDRKPPKPVRAWAVADKRGQVQCGSYYSLSREQIAFKTKKLARLWCEHEQRPIRVLITPEPSDG